MFINNSNEVILAVDQLNIVKFAGNYREAVSLIAVVDVTHFQIYLVFQNNHICCEKTFPWSHFVTFLIVLY